MDQGRVRQRGRPILFSDCAATVSDDTAITAVNEVSAEGGYVDGAVLYLYSD